MNPSLKTATVTPMSFPSRLLFALLALLLAACSAQTPPQQEASPPLGQQPFAAGSDLERLQEAANFTRQGQLREAIASYDLLIQEHPRSPYLAESYFKRGELFLHLGEQANAMASFQAAMALGPGPFHQRADWQLRSLSGQNQTRGELDQSQITLLGDPSQAGENAWSILLENYTSHDYLAQLLLQTFGERTLTRSQERLVAMAANHLPLDALQALLNKLPVGSPLKTTLLVAAGDKAAAAGQEDKARGYWRAAASRPGTMANEANLRLSPSASATPLQVGLLLPMSGRFQPLGDNLMKAAQQSLGDHRDAAITLVVRDTGGEEEKTRQAMSELMAAGVHVIVGPVFHHTARLAAQMAAQGNIPIITLNPHADIAQGLYNVYLNAFRPDDQARFMARTAVVRRGARRLAIIAPDSDYGRLAADAFAQEAAALGATVIARHHIPDNTHDFSQWIKPMVHFDDEQIRERLAQAGSAVILDPSDPLPPRKRDDVEPWADFDAVFLPLRADQARLIAPQFTFYGARPPAVSFLGTALWNRPELLSGGTDYLTGALFCDADPESAARFNSAFKARWGEDANTLSQLTYDGVAAIAQALRDERLGGMMWQMGLVRPSGFVGASGRFFFSPDGGSSRKQTLLTVAQEGIVPVEP